MSALLEVRKLSYIYHSPDAETQAISEVSFGIEREEFVAIVGPSGCGKTTILSLIAGILEPLIGRNPVRRKTGKGSGWPYGVYAPKGSAFRVEKHSAECTSGPRDKAAKRRPKMLGSARSLLKNTGFPTLKKRPSELSGGMRQRAALIRTLVTSPELLLLDEPFSALDFQTRLTVCDDVYRIIREEKKTVVFVTHDIAEAISMAEQGHRAYRATRSNKNIYTIDLDKSLSPLRRRELGFADYFKRIWSDLEVKKCRKNIKVS